MFRQLSLSILTPKYACAAEVAAAPAQGPVSGSAPSEPALHCSLTVVAQHTAPSPAAVLDNSLPGVTTATAATPYTELMFSSGKGDLVLLKCGGNACKHTSNDRLLALRFFMICLLRQGLSAKFWQWIDRIPALARFCASAAYAQEPHLEAMCSFTARRPTTSVPLTADEWGSSRVAR